LTPSGDKKICSLMKTGFSKEYGNVTLREFEGIDCKGASLLEGFPSTGLVSTIAASYIVDALKLPVIGVISSPAFPPTAVVRGHQPYHPVRIYGDKRLVVFLCEFKTPSDATFNLVQAILDFALRHEMKMIYTIEGLPVEAREPGMPVHYITTDISMAQRLDKLGLKHVDEGVVSGVTGGLLAEGSMCTHQMTCLLSPAMANFPDARAAIEVIRIIDEIMDEIRIDLGPLEKKALEMERMIKDSLESTMEAAKNHPPSAQPQMYG
jgi:uncharacterized protein